MELTITQQQRQLLSQQMIQSSNILQMTSQELYTYLQEAALENPVMEVKPPSVSAEPLDSAFSQQQRSAEEYLWLSASDESNRYLYEQQERDEEGENRLIDWQSGKKDGAGTLFDALWEQLVSIPFRAKDAATLKYILSSLDSWGYLREPLEQIGIRMEQPPKRMEQLLAVIQELDPPGVGARSLEECLLLQLKRQMDCPETLAFIVTHCLDLLAKNQIPAIAKKAGVSVKEAARLCQIIRGLNPKPGARFSDEDCFQYIHPDILVSVREEDGTCTIQLNESMYPQIEINHYYHQLSRSTEEPEVQNYLFHKIQQAEWLRTCIAQRNDTLLRTVRAILEAQPDFLKQGPSALKPLRLSDIAASLNLHESTVSRAVRNKYLQCCQGILPLSYFFSARLSAPDTASQKNGSLPDNTETAECRKNPASAKAAKTALGRVIAEENKQKPYSDRILAEKLSELGIAISRRTVAKYRESMGIPDAGGRKDYGNT